MLRQESMREEERRGSGMSGIEEKAVQVWNRLRGQGP